MRRFVAFVAFAVSVAPTTTPGRWHFTRRVLGVSPTVASSPDPKMAILVHSEIPSRFGCAVASVVMSGDKERDTTGAPNTIRCKQ